MRSFKRKKNKFTLYSVRVKGKNVKFKVINQDQFEKDMERMEK